MDASFTFGKKVHELRTLHNMTTSELASALQAHGIVVTADYVNKVENGEVIPKSKELVQKLATIFEVSQAELEPPYGRTQPQTTPPLPQRVPPNHETADDRSQDQTSSLKETLKNLGMGAGITHLYLILILSGFQAFLIRLLSNPFVFGGEEAAKLLEVFAVTFPLTLAIGLIGVIIPYFYSSGGGGGWIPVIAAILILSGAAYLGNALGAPIQVDPPLEGGNPLSALVNILYGYTRAYGIELFVSSCLLGAYIAWAWHYQIKPYLQAHGLL